MSAPSVYVSRWATGCSPGPVSLGYPPRPASRSGSGTYEIAAFAFSPGAREILCALFKSEVSISPNSVELLQLSPTGLQSQIFWGLFVPMLDPSAMESVLGLWTLTFMGEPLLYNISLVCELPTPRVMRFDYIFNLPFQHISLWTLMYLVVEDLFW